VTLGWSTAELCRHDNALRHCPSVKQPDLKEVHKPPNSGVLVVKYVLQRAIVLRDRDSKHIRLDQPNGAVAARVGPFLCDRGAEQRFTVLRVKRVMVERILPVMEVMLEILASRVVNAAAAFEIETYGHGASLTGNLNVHNGWKADVSLMSARGTYRS
jgi:hypothetical protein